MRRRHSRARGSMMLELVFASALSVMVIALLVATQIGALRAYQRALNQNAVSRATYGALREIRGLAQQAVSVTLSGGGTQATLLMPQRDASGAVRLPIQPDTANPFTLTVNFAAGTLTLTSNGTTRTLLTGISSRTPQGANYTPFAFTQYAPGVAALHVRLSVRQGNTTTATTAWFEETILLRNAPVQ